MRILVILLSLFAHLSVNAQYQMKCDNVIFPGCSGGGSTGGLILNNNNLKNSPICDTAYIIQDAMFGTVEYVGSGGNLEVNDMYNYTTNTNCEAEDRFLAVECCTDDAGVFACDTIEYGLHLSFQCQTPPDLFCCIPPNGTILTFDVLANDSEFIDLTYPQSTIISTAIAGITDGVNGPNTELVLLDDNTFQYANGTGQESIDDFSYNVIYEIETVDGDTITICDEQTCYVIVEDCLKTMPDEYCIAPGDKLCINPLGNDSIQITQNSPILDSLRLECQTVLIDTVSLMISPQFNAPTLYNDGICDYTFSSPTTGMFTYTYEVCTDLGACKTDTIVVKVEGCYFEELVLDGDFNDVSGSTFRSEILQNCGCEPESWCIDTDPRNKCGVSEWRSFGAPPYCSPNFLIIDGFDNSIGMIWEQSVNIEAGKEYEFSFWYYPNLSGGGNPNLNIQLNGTSFGNTTGMSNTWTKYVFNTTPSTTGTVTLAIVQTTSPQYSDYAIDHISLRKICPEWNICDPVIDLGDSPLYANIIHAQNQVISSGTIPADADVSLKAGQCIRLNAGFNSDVNADLQITIEDCSPVCCPLAPLSAPWMQTFVSNPEYSIEQATNTNGDCVFRIRDACNPFEITTNYYDCTGNLICQTFQVGGDCPENFLEELYDLILLKECG